MTDTSEYDTYNSLLKINNLEIHELKNTINLLNNNNLSILGVVILAM